MRTTPIIVVLLLLTFGAKAQTFQERIATADKLYQEQKFTEAAAAYTAALALAEGTALHYYNAACSQALAGDTLGAIANLQRAAGKGWMNVKHAKRDKDLMSLHTVSGWEDALAHMQKNLDIHEKDFDKPLKAQLERIYVRDQTLRQLYREAEEKFGKDSDEMTYFWQLMAEQDSLNEREVARILDERGWVGQRVVGGQANMTLWLVIQHAPLEMQEKYLPLMKESVLARESSGNHLAMLEDRIQMRKGEPQTYGSQIIRDEQTGKQVLYEIRAPEYVNQRRKEVGLGPIEEYVRRWGIEWTVEQKEK